MTFNSLQNIVDRAWGRLLTQFRRKDSIRQYIAGLVEPSADIEKTLEEITDQLNVETATGDLLDKIGAIVGQERNGQSDAIYRVYVKARLLVNRSNGTAHDLLSIIDLVAPTLSNYSGNPLTLRLRDYPPAAFEIELTGFAITYEEQFHLGAILQEADGAGIRMDVSGSLVNGPYFRFAGDGVTGADNGFGNGKFIGVFNVG